VPASDPSAFRRAPDRHRRAATDSEEPEDHIAYPADEWDQPEAAFRMAGAADAFEEEESDERASFLKRRQAVGSSLRRLANLAGSSLQAVLAALHRFGRGLGAAARFAYRIREVRYALGVLVIAGMAAGGIWWAIDAFDLFDRAPAPPPSVQPAPPAAAAATDPYTLQVAAYLKPEYALKLVEELKRKGLDAYWTETSSGGKLWYQVRISHFPDQESARNYGRNLKWKGLIDDFYVTNYVR
jgi:hypothetical protein